MIVIKLKSKLKTTYKTEAPENYLTGASFLELDPIFAGRLAYAAKDNKVKLHLTEGFRSHERQADLYRQYQEYLKTGKGNIKLAAKPGTSRHEYRLAIDTSTYPIRGMNNSQLSKYGLCKPIASEPWHIEPIELLGLNINQIKQKYLPEEVEDLTEKETEKLFKKMFAEEKKIYKKVSDLEDWAKPTIQDYVKKGYIAENSKGEINMSEDLVRNIVIMERRLG